MRRLTTLVAVLLLLTTAAPVMACVSGRAMNHSESVCCIAMHGKCGAMMKQGCCRTVSQVQTPMLGAQSPNLEIHWVAFTRVDFLFTSNQKNIFARWLTPEEHSPPGVAPAQTTVLRI